MNTKALFESDEFFKLTEADLFEIGLTPLVSRQQPTGFFDKEGICWVAIETDEGLKRRKI